MPSRRPADLAIDSPERRRLPQLLRRSWYGLNQAFRRRIAHLGITPDQFTVMRTLLEHGNITQRELTRFMTSDPNTIASLLERMEEARLILRSINERDRRANSISLRPLGRKRYEKARQIAVALQTEILSELPKAERERFLQHLDAVSEACRRAAEYSPRSKAR